MLTRHPSDKPRLELNYSHLMSSLFGDPIDLPAADHILMTRNNTPANILLNVLLAEDERDGDTSDGIYKSCYFTRILFCPCLLLAFSSAVLLIFLIRL